jgi:hypothetical protein
MPSSASRNTSCSPHFCPPARRSNAGFAELHPYELPEHVELAIAGGGDGYLQWLSEQVARDAGQ